MLVGTNRGYVLVFRGVSLECCSIVRVPDAESTSWTWTEGEEEVNIPEEKDAQNHLGPQVTCISVIPPAVCLSPLFFFVCDFFFPRVFPLHVPLFSVMKMICYVPLF